VATLQAMLPPLAGKRVLDLGCGYGWFCRWAQGQGAARVVGMDVSHRMLERARELGAGDTETSGLATIEYLQGDLERLDLEPMGANDAAFDIAYSALALHYVVDLAGLFRAIRGALTPGSPFVFSCEHPMVTAPQPQGWITRDEGRKAWPVDSYLDEGSRTTDWLAPGVVKQHRTLASYLNLLMAAGFTLERIEEWGPSDADLAVHPDWAGERERPPFLLVAARAST
jgi:SAM-dependent methyltransferase